MTRVTQRFSAVVFSVAVAMASSAAAQTAPKPAPAPAPTNDTRSAKTTANGDTGLFFVPIAEVLPAKKFSFSLYRTNFDDGQGFSDMSNFPVTVAVGIGGHVEAYGAFNVLTRIDRRARPLFFTSSAAETDTGTGGGILPNYPLMRNTWVSTVGDWNIGAKFNLASEADKKPIAFAIRGGIKIPTGSQSDGTSSGKIDYSADAIISKEAGQVADLSAYVGYLVRGNPSGYSLTNSVRWGAGIGLPTRKNFGFTATAEVFGEFYNNKTITAPAGLKGVDGSIVPTSTTLKNPLYGALGAAFEFSNGLFIGAAANWNFAQKGRTDAAAVLCATCPASFSGKSLDAQGINVRIGYHPGTRKVMPPPPPPPPPPPANRPPTVKASCDPCTVEIGKTSTVSADAQDPDGDALTYAWRTPAGSVTSATNRQTPWTAPMTEGPVTLTVTVNDGKGGTASATTTINVVKPVVKEIVFEDVHFDFDRSMLRADALRVLDEAVVALKANANLKLEIEGHTCNIGTAEYNLALGDRRAKSVADYLASRGIGADRLRTVSYGEEKPKSDNSREETRRLNRRAALVVRIQ